MLESAASRDPVEELAEEFLARLRRGERPALSEYIDRHPELADDIRELFPALAKIEHLRPATADCAGAENRPIETAAGRRLERLGDFRILREVGRGGMGVVYEAEQVSLGRHVALKVLPGHAVLDPRRLHRFRREARSAARLHHTNIVPVFGVGEEEGVPYFVMQFIHGLGLDEVVRELIRIRKPRGGLGARADRRRGNGHAPTEPLASDPAVAGEWSPIATTATHNRAPSASDVARTLLSGRFASTTGMRGPENAASAHADSAAHAGLNQPSRAGGSTVQLPGQPEGSSLADSGKTYWRSVARIGEQVAEAIDHAAGQGVLHRDIKPSNLLLDAQGTVWVTDFGLAKADADADDITETGDVLGTLRYMAPERIRGKGDVRADLYSLGLTLYELLTLRPAFSDSDREKLLHRVLHEELAPPRRLEPAIPSDLETIVLKATEKEPERRYPTARALADDLRRFLNDEPIRARQTRPWERAVKWARRRPAMAAMIAAVCVLLASLLGGGVWSYVRIDEALRTAQRERTKATESFKQEFAARRATDQARVAEAQTRIASQRLSADLALDQGIKLAENGQVGRGLLWMARARELAPEGDEGRKLADAARANLVSWSARAVVPRAILTAPSPVMCLAISVDGRTLAAGCKDGSLHLWELPAGRHLGSVRAHRESIVALAFRPDGQALVTTGGHERTARLWDRATLKPLGPPLNHAKGNLHAVQFGRDGRDVFLIGSSRLGIWRTAPDQQQAGDWDDFLTDKVTETSDGKRLAGYGFRGVIQVWDRASGRAVGPRLTRGGDNVVEAAFLDGGKRLISAGTVVEPANGDVLRFALSIFEVEPGRLVTSSALSSVPIGPMAVRPDEQVVAAGNALGTVQLFDTATCLPVGAPMVHGDIVGGLEFSPDGRTLVTTGYDGTCRLFDGATGRLLVVIPAHRDRVTSAHFAADGRTLVTSSWDATVRIWDVAAAMLPGRTLVGPTSVQTAEFSPDGRLIAAAGLDDRTARLLDVATGLPTTPPLVHAMPVRVARFSPDGRRLATGGDDRAVHLWDVATGQRIGFALPHPHWVVNAVFSRDGRRLLVGCVEGRARLWDVTTGTPIGPVLTHRSLDGGHEIWNVAFGLGGRVALTGSTDGTLELWDSQSGRRLGDALTFPQPIYQFRVSSDDKSALIIAGDGIHTVELATRRESRARFAPGARSMAFVAEGRTLLVGSIDKTARLWDSATGQSIGPPFEHESSLVGVAVSPNGRMFLTASFDGVVRFWDATTGKPVGPALRHPRLAPKMRSDDRPVVAFHPSGDWALSAGRTLRLWSVPALPADGPDSLTADGAAAAPGSPSDPRRLAGMEFDDQGTLRALEPEVWSQMCHAEEERSAGSLTASDDRWHEEAATEGEGEGFALASRWHLERLIATRAQDGPLHVRRAWLRASDGRFEDARTDIDDAFSAGPRDLCVDLLAHRAHDAQMQGRANLALWGLDQAVRGRPTDWRLLARRALVRDTRGEPGAREDANRAIAAGAGAGADAGFLLELATRRFAAREWTEAADLLARARRAGPGAYAYWHFEAQACLLGGDPPGYRALCTALLDRVGSRPLSPSVANDLAWICILGPDGRAMGLAEMAVSDARTSTDPRQRHVVLNTYGAALYRAGRFREAIDRISDGIKADGGSAVPEDCVFLALACHRLGQFAEARRWLDRVRSAAPPDSAQERLDREIFLREAETAIVRDPAFPADPFARGAPVSP